MKRAKHRFTPDETIYDLDVAEVYALNWLREVSTRSDALTAIAWLKDHGKEAFSLSTFYQWKQGGAPTYQMLRSLARLRGARLCIVLDRNVR